MRISDWSSDVCSSDLRRPVRRRHPRKTGPEPKPPEPRSTMNGIPFPAIDPVIFHLGPFAVRWYAIAYLVGFVAGWRYCIHLAKVAPVGPSAQDMDDFLTWAVIGTILGGRLGYVLLDRKSNRLNSSH